MRDCCKRKCRKCGVEIDWSEHNCCMGYCYLCAPIATTSPIYDETDDERVRGEWNNLIYREQ